MTRSRPAVAALWPAGAPGDPALTFHGATWTYREFSTLIDAAETGSFVDISGMTTPDALAASFAAVRAGTSVLIGDPSLRQYPLVAANSAAEDPGAATSPRVWLVAMTSGTSGRPRAIHRTAESWAASVAPLASLAGLTAADRVALTGPLHATLHLHAAIHTLCIGAHLTDDVSGATAVHCVPAVLDGLLHTTTHPPLLRTAIVAGSALPEPFARAAAAQGISIIEYYGAAELSFVAARRWPDPLLRPFAGVELRVDPNGILWARSPYLALGYAEHQPPSQPEHRWRPRPLRRDPDGFATVGDLVEAASGDPMGGIAIRGRGTSAITVGGFTVLAEDVEAALESIAGVRAATAVGLPNRRLGQVIAALIELDDRQPDGGAPGDGALDNGRALDAALNPDIGSRPGNSGRPNSDSRLADIRSAARLLLSGAARPRRYIVVDRLPRTASGKVSRTGLDALIRGSKRAAG